MTAVVDITCPVCDRAGPVQKRSLGRYYCADCGEEFSRQDIR